MSAHFCLSIPASLRPRRGLHPRPRRTALHRHPNRRRGRDRAQPHRAAFPLSLASSPPPNRRRIRTCGCLILAPRKWRADDTAGADTASAARTRHRPHPRLRGLRSSHRAERSVQLVRRLPVPSLIETTASDDLCVRRVAVRGG